jgi:multimeric flavodoxin WrbA
MKPKILAIIGSQRVSGNSYQLAKTVLNSTDCVLSIIQLSKKKIDYCTVCGECVYKDCILDDCFNEIMGKMNEADGIIFILPKYLLAPALFTAFLERLATITHMRKHQGYGGDLVKPEYSLFKGMKPFCVFAISGRGDFGEDLLRHVTRHIEYVGLKLVKHLNFPFIAVDVLAGDSKGEVLNNTEALS